MKRMIPFLLIYVLIQQSGETIKATWTDGQPVDQLLQGKTYQIVSKAVFDATPGPTPLTPEQITASLRLSAIDELLNGTQPLTKVERASYLVILDEINLIRSLLVPSQSPRTITQFKTAVQNKITSGTAD